MNPKQTQMMMRKLEQLEKRDQAMTAQIQHLNDYAATSAKRIETLGKENQLLKYRIDQAERVTVEIVRRGNA